MGVGTNMKIRLKSTHLCIFAVLLSLFIASKSFASIGELCGGTPNAVIETNRMPASIYSDIQTVLDDYASYGNNDRYEICFEFRWDNVPGEDYIYQVGDVNFVLNFNPSGLSKDVVIQGLKIRQTGNFTSPLLQINSGIDHEVVIQDLVMQDAKNGISVVGSKVKLINPDIGGDGSGNCVHLFESDQSTIIGGQLTSCLIAALIDNSSDVRVGATSAAQYAEDMVRIHGNDKGIVNVGGDRNMWAYNKFYGNITSPISIDSGQEDLVRPIVVVQDDKAMACLEDEEGNIKARAIKFNLEMKNGTEIPKDGVISLYKVYGTTGLVEGDIYCGECVLDDEEKTPEINEKFPDDEGYCIFTEFTCPELVLDPKKCGLANNFITAMYTNEQQSSTEFSGEIDLGNIVVFASGLTQPTDAPHDQMTADMPAETEELGPVIEEGELASGPVGGGITIAPAAGGMCGAQLIPYDTRNTIAPSIGIWWIIFCIGLFASLRLRKAHIKRRRKK
jgi:hypothetical protein